MRVTRGSVAVCALTLALATACVAAAPLAGSEWRPTEIGGVAVPADADMFVRFGGAGKLQGHGGCNGFFGTYELTGDTIRIGRLGATRMACPEPIMDREARFLEALAKTRRFVRDRIDLSLTDEAGNPVIRLIQTDAD